MAQLMWVPHYLRDIESDLSAFHRVDDWRDLPAPRFFALAWRLPSYRGAMRDRVMAEARERENGPKRPVRQQQAAGPASSRPRRDASGGEYRELPAKRVVLENEPAFKGIFSFGTAQKQPS